MTHTDRRITAKTYFLSSLSGVMLGLAFVRPELYLCAWFAFIPLLFVASKLKPQNAYFPGLICGISSQLIASQWVVEFIALTKGLSPLKSYALAFTYWFYHAQVIALALVLYTWITRTLALPSLLTFPLITATFFKFYPTLFPTPLSLTQASAPAVIQATEFTGTIGVDFLICFVNVTLYSFIANIKEKTPFTFLIIPLLIPAIWVGYGHSAVHDWDTQFLKWNLKEITLIQSNKPPILKIPEANELLETELVELSIMNQAPPTHSDLIVWPENRFLGYYESRKIRNKIKRGVKNSNTAVIFQDLERVRTRGSYHEYNTAVHLNPSGEFQSHYRKIERVPFGEYLPLLNHSPYLSEYLRTFLGEFLTEITAGKKMTTFSEAGMNIIPSICFEITQSHFTARRVATSPTGAVLVVLSNDVWFENSNVSNLHFNTAVLRAVENRVPVIHVINNGPSGIILPNGKPLLKTKTKQQLITSATLPYSNSSGGSFYSYNPELINRIFLCTFVLLMLASIFGTVSFKVSDRRA